MLPMYSTKKVIIEQVMKEKEKHDREKRRTS
jgi:hypothetical protein